MEWHCQMGRKAIYVIKDALTLNSTDLNPTDRHA